MQKITIDNVEIGGQNLTIIAGPCQIESKEHAMKMASALKEICDELGVSFVFKASYDKANRSSIDSARGVGITEGLKILAKVRDTCHCPVITDVHSVSQCEIAADFVDIVQIPAFLCRQTDLLIAAAKTGKVVNVKKGQFLAPWDMKNVVKKLEASDAKGILLTERGTTFGYNTLVNDFRAIPIMQELGHHVVFDATHSVQSPGGQGDSTGGDRRFVAPLAKAALSVGCNILFIETHHDPQNAPSDGPNMVPLKDFKPMIHELNSIYKFLYDYHSDSNS